MGCARPRIIALVAVLALAAGAALAQPAETRDRHDSGASQELDTRDEALAPTAHPKIFVARIAEYPGHAVREAVARLMMLADEGRDQDLREYLSELLPEAQLCPVARIEVPAIVTAESLS